MVAGQADTKDGPAFGDGGGVEPYLSFVWLFCKSACAENKPSFRRSDPKPDSNLICFWGKL